MEKAEPGSSQMSSELRGGSNKVHPENIQLDLTQHFQAEGWWALEQAAKRGWRVSCLEHFKAWIGHEQSSFEVQFVDSRRLGQMNFRHPFQYRLLHDSAGSTLQRVTNSLNMQALLQESEPHKATPPHEFTSFLWSCSSVSDSPTKAYICLTSGIFTQNLLLTTHTLSLSAKVFVLHALNLVKLLNFNN